MSHTSADDLLSPCFPQLNISQVFDVNSTASSNILQVPTDVSPKSQNTNPNGEGRVMILCFDGTLNKFGTNSNVVRFFRSLAKTEHKKQIVYYQPGIGTYTKNTFITHTASSAIDALIALQIGDHIKDGYRFIVQNYRKGDRICLFGFSRGAHTARVIAGMVHKVGILPKENIQQLDFAFNVYCATGNYGCKLSREFKNTFTPASTHKVSVDFVGVWDTVSSVGIIPKMHPYTSVNYAVKKFRHALSLDEHRARFRPNVWSEITLLREHDLDVDIPIPDLRRNTHTTWEYVPPDRDLTDVKEVWFAGTHADVGGGSHPVTRPTSLSFIPLRWMIKECILSETGIVFDLDYLRDDLDFDFNALLKEICDDTKKQNRIKQYNELKAYCVGPLEEINRDHATKDVTNGITHTDNRQHELLIQRPDRHARDILDEIFDQLVIIRFWWLLEFLISTLYSYQDHQGNWVRRRMPNLGRGRYLPVCKDKVLVHSSVKRRINGDVKGERATSANRILDTLKDRFWNRDRYTPRAYNWDYLQEQNIIEYVD